MYISPPSFSLFLSSNFFSLSPLSSQLTFNFCSLSPSLPPSLLPYLPSFPLPPPPRKAMEKMQSVYAENPKMGDPNSLAQSLEQTGTKIAGLVAEREKFQVRLTDTGTPFGG